MLVVADAEKPCPQRDFGRQIETVTRRRADGLTQPALPTNRWHRRRPSQSRPARPASPAAAVPPRPPGNTVRRLSWRPTTSASAAPSASTSSAPADPKRGRHVVDRRPALELVEEPQPAPGQTTTEPPRAAHRPPTAHADPPPPDTGRQLGHRGRLEQRAHRKAGIQAGVDRGDHPHRRQRIPTQIEKRVIDPDPLHPEYLGVDAGQDLLDRAGRGAVAINIAGIRVPARRGCRVCRWVSAAVLPPPPPRPAPCRPAAARPAPHAPRPGPRCPVT